MKPADHKQCPSETLPYKKKSVHTHYQKSKHQHIFEPCVFEYKSMRFDHAHGFVKDVPQIVIGGYCPMCGKRGEK